MNMLRTTILALFLAAALFEGCARKSGDEDAPAPAALVSVHTGVLTKGSIAATATVQGKTDVLRKEKIVSPVAGKIASMKVLEYQSVRAGDMLAVIQTRESQAAIEGTAFYNTTLLRNSRTDIASSVY